MEKNQFSLFNSVVSDSIVMPEVDEKPTDQEEPETNEEPEVEEEEPENPETPEDEPEGKGKPQDEEESPFIAMAQFLDEKGVIDYDPEEFEDSEEGLAKSIEAKIQKGIKSWKDSLGQETQELINYLEEGGTIKKFFELAGDTDLTNVSDDQIEDDLALQRKIVTTLLQKEGYNEDEIDAELADYESSGILINKAKRAKGKLAVIQEKEKTAEIERVRREKEAELEDHKLWLKELKKDLDTREDIAGFKLDKKQREEFYEYITRYDRKTNKTQFMLDSEADPEAQLKMAWLFYNKFDFNKVVKQAKKEVSSNLRQTLSRAKSEGKGFKTTTRTQPTEESSNFSLFKNALK